MQASVRVALFLKESEVIVREFATELVKHVRDVKRRSTALNALSFESVVANLNFVHDAVIASEQLLIEGAEWAQKQPPSTFHSELFEYYTDHLCEEMHHLRWLEDDLGSVGQNVSEAPVNALAMAMVGTQYFMLKHVHPSTLLGYLAVVEGDPVPLETVEFLETLYGKELFRFVRFHAQKDIEHAQELFKLIDEVPSQLHYAIMDSADNALSYLTQASTAWLR